MVKNKKLIKGIKEKRVKALTLGFEATRLCNYACKHCYVGEPEPVELDPLVAQAVLDYFNNVRDIHIYGGETMLSTTGLKTLDTTLGEAKTKFNSLSFVTNGYYINEEIMEILESIYDKADRTQGDYTIKIAFSNDYWHRKEEQRLGIPRKEIYNNYLKTKKAHPRFEYGYRKYESKKAFGIAYSGRARNIIKPTRPGFNSDLLFYDEICNNLYQISKFNVNAKGKVVVGGCGVSYTAGDTRVNKGDILQTPIPDILIEHGWGAITHNN